MIGTSEAAELLNVSARRIRQLCEQGRVRGAVMVGKTWAVPDKPVVDESASGGDRQTIIKMRKVKK